jgi:hypothetical protein
MPTVQSTRQITRRDTRDIHCFELGIVLEDLLEEGNFFASSGSVTVLRYTQILGGSGSGRKNRTHERSSQLGGADRRSWNRCSLRLLLPMEHERIALKPMQTK